MDFSGAEMQAAEARDRLADKNAEIAELRAALEPFAKLKARIHQDAPNYAALVLTTLGGGIIDTSNRVTVGDLHRAAEALIWSVGGGIDGEIG